MSMKRLKIDVLRELEEHDFTIIEAEEFLLVDGYKVNGYFCSEDMEFAYVKGCNDTFVHESCHLDQFLEDCPVWQRAEGLGDINPWSNEDYTEDELRRATIVCRELELDCEMRAVQKMRDYRCRIDYEKYIRRANAYALCYTYMLHHPGVWYDIGNEPYRSDELLKMLPTDFHTLDYTTLTDEQYEMLSKYLH